MKITFDLVDLCTAIIVIYVTGVFIVFGANIATILYYIKQRRK